jgi:hypothetical protein
MKIKLAASFLCLSMLCLPSVCFASTPSTKNARRATFNEINDETSEKIQKYEESEISCRRLTSNKYRCSFDYYSERSIARGCPSIRGYSYIIFDRYGTEVRLHINPNPCVEQRTYSSISSFSG